MPIDIVFFDRRGELIAIVSNKAWVFYQHSQPLLDTYDWWKECSINKFPVKQPPRAKKEKAEEKGAQCRKMECFFQVFKPLYHTQVHISSDMVRFGKPAQ